VPRSSRLYRDERVCGQSRGPVYSYTVPTGGYGPVGNLLSYVDSSMGAPVMGTWTFTYDALNRLISGTPSAGSYTGTNLCWS
jgi:YD repeat-containing protein